MKKKYRQNEFSDRTCVDCGRRLKMNLLDKKKDARLCFSCFSVREHGRGNVNKKAIQVLNIKVEPREKQKKG